MFIRMTAGLMIGMAALAAQAQTSSDIKAGTPHSAYAQDSRGVVVRSGSGLCLRSGYWSAADSVTGCDGQLTAPVTKITAPPPPATPAPAAPPIAALPAPTPKPAPVPCDSSVTLGADEAFAFDRSVLTPAAKRQIDAELPQKLAACGRVDLLVVTGHSDRIGSNRYNQKLSEQRADAVVAYIRSKGINPRFETLGAGKTQPIKSCSGELPRKKLIECLAPNRRVVIEIRGSAK